MLAAVLWMPAYAVTPAPKNIFSVSEDGKMVEIYQTIITGLYQWEKAKEKEQNGWRLLTSDEWTYLLVTRDDADHYNTGMNNLGQIELTSGSGEYKHGLIILPDGWIQPEGTAFNCVHTGITFETNSYSYEQWEKMKAAGAVFLPADGYGYNGEKDLLDEDKMKVRKSVPDSIHEPGVHWLIGQAMGFPLIPRLPIECIMTERMDCTSTIWPTKSIMPITPFCLSRMWTSSSSTSWTKHRL